MSTFTFGLAVLGVQLLAILFLMMLVSNHLKESHRAIWEQFRPNRWSGLEPLNPFLSKRVYLGLADEKLTRLSLAVVWLRRLWLASALLWVLWLFAASR